MEKVLLWDFDGTLVYQLEPFVSAAEAAFEQCGLSVSKEDIRAHLDDILTWKKPDGDYTMFCGDRWWEYLFEKLYPLYQRFGIDRETYGRLKGPYRDKVIDWSKYTLYPDAVSVLQKCVDRGYRNYIMSNNYPELVQVVEQLGLKRYFTDYFVSACVGYDKPRRELFEYALLHAGKPDCCYMVGDNPVADIEGGRGVGLKTVLVHKDCESKAEYTCRELSEIPALLI